MAYEYDINEIKNNLTLEQMIDILNDLGAEPQPAMGECIHCKTVCHNGNHKKLYWYSNTKLFHCFSDCGASFDIFELVRKVKSLEDNQEWSLPKAVNWVANYFGISGSETIEENKIEDWKIFDRYDRINNIDEKTKIVELTEYSAPFIKNLPRPRIPSWEAEGITKETMDLFEICYEPKQQCIVIPHRDFDGRLIGIRQRTMIQEIAEKYGKYRPLKFGKTTYNHPLSFNLYGLYQNRKNIMRAGRAIIFEAEKSVLEYESLFGRENNIAVAVCGSSLIEYQVRLLIQTGARNITVSLDHDFTDVNSPEAKRIIKNLKNIHKKYSNFISMDIIWDKDNLTPLKASSIDCGKEIFLQLYRNRINLY